jgi:hypothetical protein
MKIEYSWVTRRHCEVAGPCTRDFGIMVGRSSLVCRHPIETRGGHSWIEVTLHDRRMSIECRCGCRTAHVRVGERMKAAMEPSRQGRKAGQRGIG